MVVQELVIGGSLALVHIIAYDPVPFVGSNEIAKPPMTTTFFTATGWSYLMMVSCNQRALGLDRFQVYGPTFKFYDLGFKILGPSLKALIWKVSSMGTLQWPLQNTLNVVQLLNSISLNFEHLDLQSHTTHQSCK